MGQYDPSFWALLVGLPLLALLAGGLYLRRRIRGSVQNIGSDIWPALSSTHVPDEPGLPEATPIPQASRRRPRATTPPAGAQELASAIRSNVLRSVAERAPNGWTALVLCPPAHPELMTWHVHLTPSVALDLQDGRSVPVAPPEPSHEWRLPGGRVVGVGDGDPEPRPAAETVAVRVSGPYLTVSVRQQSDQPALLLARVVGAADGSPDLRAAPNDLRAVRAALREGIELAVGTRMHGTPPALGYGLSAWHGHERVWLTIGA